MTWYKMAFAYVAMRSQMLDCSQQKKKKTHVDNLMMQPDMADSLMPPREILPQAEVKQSSFTNVWRKIGVHVVSKYWQDPYTVHNFFWKGSWTLESLLFPLWLTWYVVPTLFRSTWADQTVNSWPNFLLFLLLFKWHCVLSGSSFVVVWLASPLVLVASFELLVRLCAVDCLPL